MKSLRRKLYKEILWLQSQLESKREAGVNVDDEHDLPTMAAACMYDGVRCCGFSSHSKHIKRNDVYPFEPLIVRSLWDQDHRIRRIPDILFYTQEVFNVKTGKIEKKQFVDKFIGTCAEDNAANCVLRETKNNLNKPKRLKQLVFDYPLRTRTYEREKMCKVCNKLFNKP
jgi:hypothetical protein